MLHMSSCPQAAYLDLIISEVACFRDSFWCCPTLGSCHTAKKGGLISVFTQNTLKVSSSDIIKVSRAAHFLKLPTRAEMLYIWYNIAFCNSTSLLTLRVLERPCSSKSHDGSSGSHRLLPRSHNLPCTPSHKGLKAQMEKYLKNEFWRIVVCVNP